MPRTAAPPAATARRLLCAAALALPVLTACTATTGHAAPAPALHSAGCATNTPDDINGDGYADTVTTSHNPGTIRILYGDVNGPTTTRVTSLVASSFAGLHIGDPAGPDVIGFFNGDCYADAVFAAQDDSGQGWDGAGRAVLLVVYGSPHGLDPATAQAFPMSDIDPAGRMFFAGVTSGDFNGDGVQDVAVTAPGFVTDEDSALDGGVAVLYGSPGGLTLAGHQWFDRNTAGVPAVATDARGFGDAVAAADFTGDGEADLAIGVTGWTSAENRPGSGDPGYVLVLPGSTGGLTMSGHQVWRRNSPGVPGTARLREGFGASLAAGDVTGDGRPDLLIGVPLAAGAHTNAGAMIVLVAGPNGLTGTGSREFSRGTPGVPGPAAGDDVEFGAYLAIGDFNGDGYGDAAIGTPLDDVGPLHDAGSVTVLYGSPSGLTTQGAQLWTQATSGVTDPPENVDAFGGRLTVLRAGTGFDLLVGAPHESSAGHRENGAIVVLRGGPAGLTATGSRFIDASTLPGGAVDGGGFS